MIWRVMPYFIKIGSSPQLNINTVKNVNLQAQLTQSKSPEK